MKLPAKQIAAAMTAAAAVAAGSPAWAHPVLRSAAPTADSTVASPSEIRLSFSESLIPAFSSIALKNGAGQAVAIGRTEGTSDRRVLSARVSAKLAPGAYVVEWRAVGSDTHRVAGRYSFTVK